MIRSIILTLIILFSFTSCELIEFFEYIDYIYVATSSSSSSNPSQEPENNSKPTVTPDSDSIEQIQSRALEYAKRYCNEDTKYVYGAQDPIPRVLKVDCSGMVINCYKYGIKGTNYKLLFDDTTSSDLHSKFTNHTTNPKPGDLIFMGDKNSSTINHVGIFVKFDNEYVHFIDATEGIGVSKRKYEKSNKKIKGYGEMKFSM